MGLLHLIVFWLLGSALEATVSCGAVNFQARIQSECSFTRFPSLCRNTLMELRDHSTVHVVSALVNKTISETRLPSSYFQTLSSQLETHDAHLAKSVTGYCENLMKMSLKQLDKSLLALKESPKKNKNDIQTWLSAALTFQQACKDSADSLGLPAGEVNSQISSKMDYLSQLVSNPLALVNRITSNSVKLKNNTRTRHLGEEVEDFPKWVSARDRKLLQSGTIKANAVVAKDGTGNYKTISEAIEAASGGRFVIYVKSGVYKEKIRTNKDGITLIGDAITGDGFIARDIGFHNTAGPQGQQALALHIASDHSVLYRCSIAGYQDTLYALALRQFYRECDIYGTIDFIFGNAAAVFQNCYLVLRRPKGGAYNVILANGRTDPGQNTGFSIQNCRITASSDFSPVKHNFNSYLGRPWQPYSRSVIMESNIDDAISSRGWIEWPDAKSYGKTLYFAEYLNTGPGAGTSNRVTWPGFHVVGAQEAVKFTVGNFIDGASWLPSTGVTFVSGLQ
ncbi:hypothetical protein MANES_16G089400v8 [Manihot esculenta]|uniref:Uncharacterized protein n=1 Tax=Manihot esculenta TaxID=3983 RepID=A0ACB7G6Y1_MANES|nr:hypothetical protein MANES_16G089400v8 [Manihot esculenta]